MQTIEATLEEYIYKNESNGYCVASFSEGLKAVGILADVKVGERLRLTGQFENHSRFGKQFKIESYSVVYPNSIHGIVKYLGSGLIKGVGPALAKRIVDVFGEKTIDVLDNEISRLIEVDGIGNKKLEQIKKAWQEQSAVKDIMVFLQSYDISPAYALKIYRTYGEESITVVKENPYRLTKDVWGIGFKTADKIGKNVGFDDEHPTRIKSGIVFALNEAAAEGHVYLPIPDLLNRSCKILNIDLSQSLSLLNEMEEEGLICIKSECIYLYFYYHAERNIENKLEIINNGSTNLTEKELKSVRLDSKYYSEEQLEAIRNSLKYKILILTGGPGTGKTTTLKGIIDSYKKLNKNIMLAAPTGRAAKRMSEVIGLDAKTIHRLLEYNPIDMTFSRDEEHPLEVDLLVIDEASMIDTLLMNNLVNAIAHNTTLILVGDVDQLPSVGAGNILNDLISYAKIPTAKLTKIFRQAEESRIVVNAHRINRGEFPVILNKEESDFFFIQESDEEKITENVLDLCQKRLPEKYGFNPMNDIQVLTPMYKGETGVNNLNHQLQNALNPNQTTLVRGDKNYKIGDKVMQLKNNYEKDIFNGDIGIIRSIDSDGQILSVSFNDKIISYDFIDLDEITLAYAVTVHKSQGSEYPCVILPISTSHYIMLQRNLLYTAVTRASKMMILIGSKQALAMAINNKRSRRRYTSLFKPSDIINPS